MGKSFEREAELYVSAATGLLTRTRDFDAGPSEYDFDLVDEHGNVVAAVDVVRWTDKKYGDRSAAFSQHPNRGPAKTLQSSWVATAADNARLSGLLDALRALCERAESEGRSEFSDLHRHTDPLAAAAFRAGIQHARAYPPGEDGPTVHFAIGVGGWASDADGAARAVQEYLDSPDFADAARKLGASAAPERHAFVWIDHSKLGAWRPLIETTTGPFEPTIAIALPEGVTRLWLVDLHERSRGWSYAQAEGWRSWNVSPGS